jgi:seryl-tRNA synthetase
VFDIKWIRDNPEAFDAGLRKRGIKHTANPQTGDVLFASQLLELDEARRKVVTRLQEAQQRRNAASKEIGKAKASKDEAKAAALMAEVNALKDTLAKGEEEQRAADKALNDALSVIPNTPREDVPEGKDEHGNVEQRKVGTPPKLAGVNKPLQHFEIGERLGLMDFETAAKLSGARFVVLKGALARMERALGAFMLDLHTTEFGYTEVAPPILVRDDTMFGTAQLPKFKEDQFFALSANLSGELERPLAEARADQEARAQRLKEQQRILGGFAKRLTVVAKLRAANELPENLSEIVAALTDQVDVDVDRLLEIEALLVAVNAMFESKRWLIPTAEVPLTNLVREKITDEAELPIRVTAFTPCFRAEAGAAGKDTRGMIRQHQFSKVELVSITTPEQSSAEHERMTACAEEVLKRLGLAYRTMLLCTGDMGFASQKTYDIEVWLPGQNTYREISSCSVCGDFQARRMNARYRPKGGKGTEFVHTLNGSGLAVGRTLIAILENYQQADGSVAIPEALQPYMGGLKKIEAA